MEVIKTRPFFSLCTFSLPLVYVHNYGQNLARPLSQQNKQLTVVDRTLLFLPHVKKSKGLATREYTSIELAVLGSTEAGGAN